MDPFVGEIRLMPYSFAPRGWAFCNGQTLPITQNPALFSLLGTQYGGDGRTTFALPNLQGRTYVGAGQGQGLTNYPQGTATGTESVTLTVQQMPAHTHDLSNTATMPVNGVLATQSTPSGNYYAPVSGNPFQYGIDPQANGMASDVLNGTASAVGGNQPHENRMPYLVLNYCIALVGIFPPRP